jgi:hypothetical protein
MDYIEKTVKRLNEKEANDELNAIWKHCKGTNKTCFNH